MAEGSRVFTESQQSLLTDVINRIMPAENNFPGAGDLGVASYIDRVVAKSSETKEVLKWQSSGSTLAEMDSPTSRT